MFLISLGSISVQERIRLATITSDHELIATLMNDESIDVRKALAENSNLYENELLKLSRDKSWQVCQAVPNSPVITNRVLTAILLDKRTGINVTKSAKKAVMKMIEDLQSLIT